MAEFLAPTMALAEFVIDVRPEEIPREAIEKATQHVLDCVGVGLAGGYSQPGQIAADVVRSTEPVLGNTLFAGGSAASSRDAAWANGIAAHALDFDDTGFSHPTACLLPAALATAEEVGSSGQELLVAVVMGYEVFERIARAARPLEPELRARGVHPTALYGCAAAAASSGRLAGLSCDELATAFGLALSNAGGITDQIGTWGKGVHAGNAARAGVTAVQLAGRGYWASTSILEAEHGFYAAVLGPDRVDLASVGSGRGDKWAIVDPGLNIKPYPACGRALRAIDAALALNRKLPAVSAIQEVEIQAFPDYVHTLPYHAPLTGFHGKFSLDYCVCSALVDGTVSLESFSDEAASRPELRDLLDRTTIVLREDWPEERRRENPVTVMLKDGTSHTEIVNTPLGSRTNPLTANQLAAKFGYCAETTAMARDRIPALHEALEQLATLPRVADLMSLLHGGGTSVEVKSS